MDINPHTDSKKSGSLLLNVYIASFFLFTYRFLKASLRYKNKYMHWFENRDVYFESVDKFSV